MHPVCRRAPCPLAIRPWLFPSGTARHARQCLTCSARSWPMAALSAFSCGRTPGCIQARVTFVCTAMADIEDTDDTRRYSPASRARSVHRGAVRRRQARHSEADCQHESLQKRDRRGRRPTTVLSPRQGPSPPPSARRNPKQPAHCKADCGTQAGTLPAAASTRRTRARVESSAMKRHARASSAAYHNAVAVVAGRRPHSTLDHSLAGDVHRSESWSPTNDGDRDLGELARQRAVP